MGAFSFSVTDRLSHVGSLKLCVCQKESGAKFKRALAVPLSARTFYVGVTAAVVLKINHGGPRLGRVYCCHVPERGRSVSLLGSAGRP